LAGQEPRGAKGGPRFLIIAAGTELHLYAGHKAVIKGDVHVHADGFRFQMFGLDFAVEDFYVRHFPACAGGEEAVEGLMRIIVTAAEQGLEDHILHGIQELSFCGVLFSKLSDFGIG
jgi:hypothetical protein